MAVVVAVGRRFRTLLPHFLQPPVSCQLISGLELGSQLPMAVQRREVIVDAISEGEFSLLAPFLFDRLTLKKWMLLSM